MAPLRGAVGFMSLATIWVAGCATSDLKSIQGSWTGREKNRGIECKVVVSGNHVDFTLPNTGEWYKGAIAIDEKAVPKAVDYIIAECAAPQYVGKTSKGIYEIKDGTLTMAANEPGSGTRPVSFESADAARIFVLTRDAGAK